MEEYASYQVAFKGVTFKIELKYLVWEGTQTPLREKKDFTSVSSELDDQGKRLGLKYNRASDQVLPDVERNHRSPADVDGRPGAALPQKVEVNINDICVAFMSNLDSLSTAHIKSVGKAIAVREPQKASVMAEAIAQQSQELSVALVKACALVYPEAVRKLLEGSQNG